VGVDVQSIDEVESSLAQFGTRYTDRLFTAQELESCGENSAAAASGLAARFAAKEAVLKVLDAQETVPPWTAIEVCRSGSGNPKIVLHGDAATLADRLGITQIALSLSHGGGIATATVVAQATDSPPGGDE